MKIKSFRVSLFKTLIIAAALAVTACFSPGIAQADQGTFVVKQASRDPVPLIPLNLFTNAACANLSSYTNTTTTPSFFPVVPGSLLCVQYSTICGNLGNSNSVIQFAGSDDGITPSTGVFCSAVITNNGTTNQTGTVIVTNNVATRFIGVMGVGSSQTNAVTFTNAAAFFIPTF